MISVKSSFYSKDKWLAFPGFLVSLARLVTYVHPIDFFVNRPDLEYCFAAVETNSPNKNLFSRSGMSYPKLSDIQLGRYTIISARTQGKLKRKLSYRGVYSRSSYLDSLNNLRWISAKHHWTIFRTIEFMESPILIFDSSNVNGLTWDWCSAFISFLSSGYLNVRVSYRSFSLGKIEFRFGCLMED
jgi:hypothetical protein